jgi:prepilin-type N-terminal cleavage/methylation domain-containing protein
LLIRARPFTSAGVKDSANNETFFSPAAQPVLFDLCPMPARVTERSGLAAFTLVELLIVITIIGTLAAIILPVYGSVQLAGERTQSLNMMRQLGAATLAYCGDNNGALPQQGDATTWASANTKTVTENAQWYNIVPRNYMASKGLGDYANNQAAFYSSGSVFFVPAAKYPSNKLTAPQFAIAFNSKLITSTYTVANVRLQAFQLPAETVLYQEAGVAGETPIKGQKAYATQCASYASRTAARYNGNTILTFVDGHAGLFSGTSIVDPSSGKAFFAAYPNPFPTGASRVYWEMEPTQSPN